jgi:iron(III) transport system permease protein
VTVPSKSYRFVTIGLAALVVLAPLSLVLYQSFLTAPLLQPSAQFGVGAYRSVFADQAFWTAFGITAALASGMTVIAVTLGAGLAVLMVRTDLPGRSWLEPLVLLPLFVSTLVLAFGYAAALAPRGFLSAAVSGLTGVVPWNLYSLPALIAIAGLIHVPHVYLFTAAALRGLDTECEDAARTAGARPWQVAIDVTLPMVLPALMSAGALVFLLGFELFGLPLVLGNPEGIFVLSTYLYALAGKPGGPPYELMAVVAMTMIAVAAPLLFLQSLWRREAQRSVRRRDSGRRPARLGLGSARWPAFLAVVLWLVLALLVPLAGITLRSLAGAAGGGLALSLPFTLDHYRSLLEHPEVVRSVINTLGIGVLGGGVAIAVYAAITLAIRRNPSQRTPALDHFISASPVMPGLVVGLALLWLLLLLAPLSPLKDTPVSVWLAYTIVWLAVGVGLLAGTLRRVGADLAEVARTVGASRTRAGVDITMPLIRRGMLAAWLLVFLLFVREYATGVFLLAPGSEVIGSLLVSLWNAGAVDLVFALAVVNVIIGGVAFAIAVRLGVRLDGCA